MQHAGSERRQQRSKAAAKPMTKLPGVTSSHGPTTTTLINRSGQCYQLHRPHLALAASQESSGRAGPGERPPHKKFKAAADGQDAPADGLTLSAKQQQQRQQALATDVLLRGHAERLAAAGSPEHVAAADSQQHERPRPRAHPQRGQPPGQQPQQQRRRQQPQHQPQQPQLQQQQQRQPTAQQRPRPAQPVSTHVSSLYPEILAQIFSNLEVRDRGRAAQVCVAWREAAYQRSAWRGVQARLHLRKHSSQVFACLERRGIRRVQVLSVSTRRSGLGEVFRGIPKLQALNLSGCYHMSDQSLGGAMAAASYPQLSELDLSLCKNLTDASLGKVAQHLPNLELLRLGGCGNLTNQGLQLLAWGLKRLRRLDLRSCWLLSDQGIGHLAAGCPRLEHLGLQDCQRVSDEALRQLSLGQAAASLRSVNLSFCVLVTDSGLKHLAKIGGLRELDLRSCDNISEVGLAYLAEGGSRLRSLDLSFCDKIGDQALQHLSQGLFGLRSLSLAACPVSDEGICRIAKSQQDLHTLNIGQCAKLTDKSLFSILDHLPRLRCIDLYGCTKISKYALERFELRKPPVCLNRDLWQERR